MCRSFDENLPNLEHICIETRNHGGIVPVHIDQLTPAWNTWARALLQLGRHLHQGLQVDATTFATMLYLALLSPAGALTFTLNVSNSSPNEHYCRAERPRQDGVARMSLLERLQRPEGAMHAEGSFDLHSCKL